MAKGRGEPKWLSRVVIEAIHHEQLRAHGGLPGIRDENILEAVLARPRQNWHDQGDTDVPVLGAAYAFGLVTNHPYRDGNKRIGFLAMVTFLDVNGYHFTASEADVVTTILALADGTVSEDALADWVRHNSSQRRSAAASHRDNASPGQSTGTRRRSSSKKFSR